MAAFPASPMRLIPPLTPRRAPSPTMSPGGRRGRTYGSSEEGRLRDLSPETTLRAFTHKPIPFDTTRDEYKIFSCIESLTAAERDLGARVAKAAQRLKTWCTEIEQWGWNGSFEQPSEQYREQRRRSIEARIREHVADTDPASTLPPLEYWGSLMSVEVEQYEARVDDIEDEMLKLDVEELKEHVLDMHPLGRSRPSSAGMDAARQNYKPVDDFSFLITQTLLSALPHHAQLKDRLNTWTARVAILRATPRFVSELDTAQKAMRLGWDAIEPPADDSDLAFAQWKEAIDTISSVLRGKVADLGQRLDRMLDTLEGRDDCLPDKWIDIFESTEADYGRWAHESRRRVIELEVRRREDKGPTTSQPHNAPERLVLHSKHTSPAPQPQAQHTESLLGSGVLRKPVYSQPQSSAINTTLASTLEPTKPKLVHTSAPIDAAVRPAAILRTVSPVVSSRPALLTTETSHPERHILESSNDTPKLSNYDNTSTNNVDRVSFGVSERQEHTSVASSPERSPANDSKDMPQLPKMRQNVFNGGPIPRIALEPETPLFSKYRSHSMSGVLPLETNFEEDMTAFDEESEFEEGDTVVHYEMEDIPEHVVPTQPRFIESSSAQEEAHHGALKTSLYRPEPLALSDSPVVTMISGSDSVVSEPPQTPRSRRGSASSLSSEVSYESSPPSNIDESPSVRNANLRALRAPRPELNAAMAKRRAPKNIAEDDVISTPWPPTRFTQKPTNSAEDLERKISDILTTIPAHIRLTSGPNADSPEVKPRGVVPKSSRGYLRATRSINGLKSPELTLSPAKAEDSAHAVSGRKSVANMRGDNDIKLYHLTQPGKEQPVKLFIRRVGENGERVMVRVGGGWADLGEYLRQYAEHHGRRTASDGKFEILGLEVKNTNDSPNRPESGSGRPDRRFSSAHTPASPLTTPIKSPGPSYISSEALPRLPGSSSTPVTAEEASVPSTNSSQRSWQGNEVGLAGPKSKKLDLSGQKLEWIEGMMKQARTVSNNVIHANNTPFQRDERVDSRSESRSDSRASTRAGTKKPEFGDLGKIGGTKRIFLKGGKPVLE